VNAGQEEEGPVLAARLTEVHSALFDDSSEEHLVPDEKGRVQAPGVLR
jgi:hypothetical protein